MGTSEAGVLTEVFEGERRGLLAHAYRMLGAYHEAEDVVQDTYVRALRGWETFEGRSSPRTWLYRIATNVCLNVIEARRRRASASDPGADDREPDLEPFPTDPADEVVARESVRLAFVTGLRHLTPRQRAVLLLREVLTLSAAETGEALDMSVAAVKSTLQRARELLAGYMAAWEASDPGAFRDVLRADAAIEPVGSPPSHTGREACLAFATPSMGVPGDWRMVATEANAQPAVVAWFRGECFGVAVLTVTEGGISVITLFGNPALAEIFTPRGATATPRSRRR